MTSKTMRQIAVLASASMLLGAFVAGPADAGKRKKKKPPVPVCATFASPEWAADAEITVVTDAATAEAPVELVITTDAGFGLTSTDGSSGDEGAPSHKYHNVQVDTASAGAKLFVRAEFTEVFDYDLFLRLADESSVAYEADFNPATAAGQTPVGGIEGAHSEPGASQIDGYESADCAGYTVDLASGITPGEDVTLKVWLEL